MQVSRPAPTWSTPRRPDSGSSGGGRRSGQWEPAALGEQWYLARSATPPRLTGVHEDETRLANAVAETMRLEPSIPYIPHAAVR